METKLSQEESLKIIHEMIATSKNNLKDNSFFFLLWGWLVLAASLLHFAFIQIHWEYAYIPWPILMFSGGIISAIAGYRIGKRSKVISHIDKMLIYLWYGFLVVMLIILFMSGFSKLDWATTHALIIVLYGFGTFVSGGALKFPPLIIGGIVSWVIAIIAFFVPEQFVLLLIALSIIIAYLIPGYMLKAKH
ncbi:MAG: hypothetical protein K9G76_12105 [Bacteroidales bacterium]|nr:hypothetical protein [Bacteroidales bacterium]MCF8405271.1 hypothetical protein [Bacteroidales bacterium]